MNKLNYLNKITRLPQNPQEQSPKQRLKKKEEEISGLDILALTRWSMIKRIRSSTVIENVAPHPLNKLQQGHLLLNTEWTNYFIIKIYF